MAQTPQQAHSAAPPIYRETDAYRYFGCHETSKADRYVFRVWAPNARSIHIIGDFNSWDKMRHPMTRITQDGVWEATIDNVSVLDTYKYRIHSRAGSVHEKADPYATCSGIPDGSASIIYPLEGYYWQDKAWQSGKAVGQRYDEPLNIYEVHLGSFRRNGERYYSYLELANALVPYVKEMGYTHVELMPIMEHPFTGSWGYEVCGYFAPTTRYGYPHELMALIDRFHMAGVGVLLDWVPGHFPKDSHGLHRFDGSYLYEPSDALRRECDTWNTSTFDYSHPRVQEFLISNAHYWLNEYHFDGLRMDAVYSMLYLDYGKKGGLWTPNERGGRENLDAIAMLQKLNQSIRNEMPHAILIAEDSSTFAGVTQPAQDGGLGFTHKWNMGWTTDTLAYMQTDFDGRSKAHNKLTFSLCYAFDEHYTLAFSHDEVSNGKAALLHKLPGDREQKHAGLRAFLGYQMAHPGKKHLFMGTEFATPYPWDHDDELDWPLLTCAPHANTQAYVKELNHFYLRHPCLWQADDGWSGFRWIEPDDGPHNVLAFIRTGVDGEHLIIISNFSPQQWDGYRIGVPASGTYRETLTSDAAKFGGRGRENQDVSTEDISHHGFSQSIALSLPPISTLYLTHIPTHHITA